MLTVTGSYHTSAGPEHRLWSVYVLRGLLSALIGLDILIRPRDQRPDPRANGPCVQGHRQRARGGKAESHRD